MGYDANVLLRNGHLQTIIPSVLPWSCMPYRRERWDTPDGDYIDVDLAGNEATQNLLVLFHGLEGNSRAAYARRIGAHVLRKGWSFAVPHFRGCSGCPNRRARGYHAGDYEEIDWILRRFAQRHAGAVFAAGVSLGGNALLRWLGEYGERCREVVRRAVAISAPLDLAGSGAALARGFGRLYSGFFLSNDLRQKALDRLMRYPGVYDASRAAAARTLREFDDAVTAPLFYFRDVHDYYRSSSAAEVLADIRVPTLLVNAEDDPIMPASVLHAVRHRRDLGQLPSNVELEFSPHGGHVGFLGGGWLKRRVFRFLTDA